MPKSSQTAEFVRLLTQCQGSVYSLILASVPNWADADEILQETNVRLWEQFDKYVPGSDFCSWARTIATYQVMTYRKTRGRQREQFVETFVEEMFGAVGEVPTSARRDALLKCLERLPESNQSILRSYYAPGADPSALALALKRTVESLRLTLFRLRRALRECIERQLRIESRQ